MNKQREKLANSANSFDDFILSRFFSVGDHALALQPEHNPDQTGDIGLESPQSKDYFRWAEEMDVLAKSVLEE